MLFPDEKAVAQVAAAQSVYQYITLQQQHTGVTPATSGPLAHPRLSDCNDGNTQHKSEGFAFILPLGPRPEPSQTATSLQ